jgi:hypothetical protein
MVHVIQMVEFVPQRPKALILYQHVDYLKNYGQLLHSFNILYLPNAYSLQWESYHYVYEFHIRNFLTKLIPTNHFSVAESM